VENGFVKDSSELDDDIPISSPSYRSSSILRFLGDMLLLDGDMSLCSDFTFFLDGDSKRLE